MDYTLKMLREAAAKGQSAFNTEAQMVRACAVTTAERKEASDAIALVKAEMLRK